MLCARIWETVLFSKKVSQTEVGVYAMPRKILWEVAEQAGQERGLLAYYIAAAVAVPRADLERIQFARHMALFGGSRACSACSKAPPLTRA